MGKIIMRPSLRQLEYFVAVAEAEAFGAAATRLHVSQPSLSQQVAVLEAELGVKLFERTSRSVRLTAEGVNLLALARATLASARAFRDEARQLAGEKTRSLHAGVLPSIGAYFMPHLRERLQSKFPKLRISLEEGPTRELLSRLGRGEVDFVVASRGDATNFEMRALFDETLWFCSRPDDPLMEAERPAGLHELTGRRLLTLSPEFHLTEIVRRLASEARALINADYRGPSLDAIRQMATQGDGIAVLPSLYALSEAIRDPNFKVRRIDHPQAVHPVFLYWRRSAKDQQLIEMLAQEMIEMKAKIRAERAERFKTGLAYQ
jgi:LysR family transcriptional regulator, hydrogen peroxide-inducible genes activator